MSDLVYKTIFFIFTIYSSIHSISYAIFEINTQKNKYGGFAIIACTIFSIIFGNIIIWLR